MDVGDTNIVFLKVYLYFPVFLKSRFRLLDVKFVFIRRFNLIEAVELVLADLHSGPRQQITTEMT